MRVLLLLAVLFFLVVGQAHAQVRYVTRPASAKITLRAQLVAAKSMDNPCDFNVLVVWVKLPPAVEAEADLGGCLEHSWAVVKFNSRVGYLGWEDYCTTMLHEYGHLMGLYHSSDPSSVMFSTPARSQHCRRGGWPYLALDR